MVFFIVNSRLIRFGLTGDYSADVESCTERASVPKPILSHVTFVHSKYWCGIVSSGVTIPKISKFVKHKEHDLPPSS